MRISLFFVGFFLNYFAPFFSRLLPSPPRHFSSQATSFFSFFSSALTGKKKNRIVLENSGVAEPQNIRDKFSEAVANSHPLAHRLHLDAMVTVVDAASFVADFASRAPLAARPDLGEGGSLRPVVDLLVEQVECADSVILNKVDQLLARKAGGGGEKSKGRDKGSSAVEEAAGAAGAAAGAPASEEAALASLRAIVASLNPLARIFPCERGRVDIEAVFGREAAGLVAMLNVEGQHRGAVAHAAALAEAEKGEGGEEGGGGGGEGGCVVCAATGEDKKEKTTSSCGHGHGHGEHGHHHRHHHHHDEEEEEKKEHSHSHSHSHEHEHGAECASKGCTEDHLHHHHHHEHAAPKPKKLRQETTAAARFGIRSFVYRRRRPFHPGRLRDTVLRWLPVATNAATDNEEKKEGGGKDAADADADADAAAAAKEAEAKNPSPIRAVLRSKGFMWMSHSHATAFYWSHAGQHFEIRDEGDWWAAVPAGEWPWDHAQRAVILVDFGPGPPRPSSSSSSSSDDAVVAQALASRYGDRRQEIVFIGAGMDEGKICEALDGALLTDAELARYDQNFGVPPPSAPPAAAAAAGDGDAATRK